MEQHGSFEHVHRSAQLSSPAVHAAHDRSILEVDAIAELAGIFEPETNIAVLRRTPAAELERAARALIERRYLSIALRTSGEEHARARLRELLGEESEVLIDDVWRCAELLGEITGSAELGVRIAVLEEAMCPRFHVDYVGVRLVCTYVGPTTEFLATSEVDRCHLGHALDKPADELTGLLRRGASVRRAGIGDVVLLKGEAWPGNEGRGAVHRSPAASPSTPRLVLTIDAL
jgi:hypothetical protein